MYLKKIVCENMGPISYIDIEPGFTADDNPKPLILVGKNGSGKSVLISNIVDSFFEFGDQAYSDLTHKVNMGHSYFKMTGGNQIKLGENALCSFLQYSAGKDGAKEVSYLYHCGEFNFEAFKTKVGTRYFFPPYQKDTPKNITQSKELFEEEFQNNAIVYFPPERFSIPYWMGTAYSNSHDYGGVDVENRFKDVLKKPIIVDNATQENTQWLIDVLIDAKAELIHAENKYQISDFHNYISLCKSKENIEKIVSQIVEDTPPFELGHRQR